MLGYKTKTRPGLVALYDIRPGNGAGPFLQPRSPHGASDWELIKRRSAPPYGPTARTLLFFTRSHRWLRVSGLTVGIRKQHTSPLVCGARKLCGPLPQLQGLNRAPSPTLPITSSGSQPPSVSAPAIWPAVGSAALIVELAYWQMGHHKCILIIMHPPPP